MKEKNQFQKSMPILATAVCFLAILALAAGCADSQATLSGIKLCDGIDDGVCRDDRDQFPPHNPRIYVTGVATGVPKTGALITATWFYTGAGEMEKIDSLTLPASEEGADFRFWIEEDEQWRLGRYEVVLTTGFAGNEAEASRREFTIK
ncbi:MAG: hypothetical protein IBX61_09140 [Thermoleophilia bacterium]|nr:hypothetical protein [Thermoleophilia bacterium]